MISKALPILAIASAVANGRNLTDSVLEQAETDSIDLAFLTNADVACFLLSLSFWSSAYYYTVFSPSNPSAHVNAFAQSRLLSNVHSIPLVLLAVASLAEIIPETFPIAFSAGYFCVELVDCAKRRDVMFLVHAVLSLSFKWLTVTSGSHRVLRSCSKGLLVEASTPLLNKWKISKTKQDYQFFFAAFFVLRILWTPYFMASTCFHLKGRNNGIQYFCVAFVTLQFAWFGKMCDLLINYKDPTKILEENEGKEVKANGRSGGEGKPKSHVNGSGSKPRNGKRSLKEH